MKAYDTSTGWPPGRKPAPDLRKAHALILGSAAGIPIIPTVASPDRWNHIVLCPFCGATHAHGGHGPRSLFGAINDARFAHCKSTTGDQDRRGLLFGIDREPYYILVETRGRVKFCEDEDQGVVFWSVTFDRNALTATVRALPDFIAAYEAKWGDFIASRNGAYITTAEVLAAGDPATVTPRRCALYRHFDADGGLLYIGISEVLVGRGKRHAATSEWVALVATSTAEWFPDRATAEAAEREAIRTEHPRFNVVHNEVGRTATMLVGDAFTLWLRRRKNEASPVGDLADDSLRDPSWPLTGSYVDYRQYLDLERYADSVVLEAFEDAWRRFARSHLRLRT